MSDIEKIKKLRQSTGAGFKDCSSAILEANGDIEKAAEFLMNNSEYLNRYKILINNFNSIKLNILIQSKINKIIFFFF